MSRTATAPSTGLRPLCEVALSAFPGLRELLPRSVPVLARTSGAVTARSGMYRRRYQIVGAAAD